MSKEICKRFGARLRQIREQKKVTQMDLCFKIDMQQKTLSALENGHMEPCLEKIDMLAKGLGISLRQLFWNL